MDWILHYAKLCSWVGILYIWGLYNPNILAKVNRFSARVLSSYETKSTAVRPSVLSYIHPYIAPHYLTFHDGDALHYLTICSIALHYLPSYIHACVFSYVCLQSFTLSLYSRCIFILSTYILAYSVYVYIYIHSFIRISFACKTILMFRKHPSANPEASEPEERVPMQLLRAPLKEGVRVEAALLFSGIMFSV